MKKTPALFRRKTKIIPEQSPELQALLDRVREYIEARYIPALDGEKTQAFADGREPTDNLAFADIPEGVAASLSMREAAPESLYADANTPMEDESDVPCLAEAAVVYMPEAQGNAAPSAHVEKPCGAALKKTVHSVSQGMPTARSSEPKPLQAAVKPDWEEMMRRTDAGFSQTLLRLIEEKGMTDAQCYRKANVDRKLFSKIRSNPSYTPTKPTVFAFAVALELSLRETKDLLNRAGYSLSHSSKFDIILEYFIQNRSYNLFEINEVLYSFDMPLLGTAAR